MSPVQCRAARALLNLSRSALAAKANCAISTLRNFELELHSLQINNRRTIQRVLEGEGVEFLLAPEGLKFKGKLIGVLVTARDRQPIADGITPPTASQAPPLARTRRSMSGRLPA